MGVRQLLLLLLLLLEAVPPIMLPLRLLRFRLLLRFLSSLPIAYHPHLYLTVSRGYCPLCTVLLTPLYSAICPPTRQEIVVEVEAEVVAEKTEEETFGWGESG